MLYQRGPKDSAHPNSELHKFIVFTKEFHFELTSTCPSQPKPNRPTLLGYQIRLLEKQITSGMFEIVFQTSFQKKIIFFI
jgi:hypothetical protein